MNFRNARSGAAVAALTMSFVGVNFAAQAHSAPLHTPTTRAVTTKASSGWIAERLINVRSLGTSCGKTPIAEASGRGKMTLRIDQTESVSTSLSANINVTKGVVSAGVGWDVTKSRSITVSGSKEVPSGKYGTLKAYAKYSGKKFDAQGTNGGSWMTVGHNQTAYKPIGVCFKYSQR
ncbi:hypothetical protein [Streptomyces murinus]|uniref:hypothetical protein n=1 Tax=Streptomyces murinus TaxID=33900 RepID=UPI002E0E8CF9|nr:hypothetical protein OG516_12060 [Streptomyces murinus]